MHKFITVVLSALLLSPAMPLSAKPVLKQIAEFAVAEANQGVGVDDKYFYAIDNQTIAKYDKKTGKQIQKWQGDKAGPILHLDSAMLMDGKIYCAHSNYPEWPMTSSSRYSMPRRSRMSPATASASTGDRSPGWIGMRSLVDGFRQL